MQRLRTLISRFRKDERGVFMVIFAVMGIVLIASSGAVVDFTNMQQARTRAQTALDAATLALQGQIDKLTNEELRSKAEEILKERIADTRITAVVDTAVKNVNEGKLTVNAHIIVPTSFVQLVGISTIQANLLSEVTQASSNLEVSLSLDVTGSMAGSKITTLISATNDLIDLIVKDVQTPTYSRMAIVPWSAAVNAGSYVSDVRGTVQGPWNISAISWANGTPKTITGITKVSNGVVTTSAAHGFATDDKIYISGVNGMTQVNNRIFTITVTSTTKFQLNVNTSSYTAFSTGSTPRATECWTSTCEMRVTTNVTHGLDNGELAYITGTSGLSNFNNKLYTVAGAQSTSFILSGVVGPGTYVYNAYTSGGASHCVLYGCSYFRFDDANSGTNYQLFPVTNCVTDRTVNAYTDEPPTTNALGFNYTQAANPRDQNTVCISQAIQPLTSNKTTLHNLTNTLAAKGYTSGHLGLAWGWYMIAPKFGYLWPSSLVAPYGEEKLIKAVIFMTDGDFNVSYSSGVLAKDAQIGNGEDRISTNSFNGTSKAQAQALCNAIKVPANKTLLYTVGFDLGANSAALTFLRDCATSPDYFMQADDDADLEIAFKSIGKSLSELRISK